MSFGVEGWGFWGGWEVLRFLGKSEVRGFEVGLGGAAVFWGVGFGVVGAGV